jgi:HEAT repeat protein
MQKIRAVLGVVLLVTIFAASVSGEKQNDAVDALIKALNDNDSNVRGCAIVALGETRDIRAVDPLIKVLMDTRAVEPLPQVPWDNSNDARGNAARALGKIKDTRALDPLIQALKDAFVSDMAVYALAEINNKRTIDALIQSLSDDDSNERANAAWSLGEIINARIEMPNYDGIAVFVSCT